MRLSSDSKYLALAYIKELNGLNSYIHFRALSKCHSNCRTCSGPLIRSCTACPCGYMLVMGYCEKMTKPCAKCDGLVSTKCRACLPGYYLVNESFGVGDCEVCNQTGQAMFGGLCVNCISGLTPSAVDGHCMSCTGSYFISPTDSLCYSCAPNCLTCANSTTFCTSCRTDMYIKEDTHECDYCTVTAGYGISTGMCRLCNPAINCRLCATGLNTCTACILPYTLSESNSTCTICGGKYFVRSSTDNKCVACDQNCKTCETTPTFCTSCDSGLYVSPISHTCISCPISNFYDPGTNQCVLCPSRCLTCSSPANCQTCNPPYILSAANRTCDDCGDGYYVETSMVPSMCIQCDPSCSTCSTTSSYCTRCSNSSLYSNETTGLCVACNQVGYSAFGHSCRQCNPSKNCSACTVDVDTCTACLGSYQVHFANKSCAPCGAGYFVAYYQAATYCEPCSKNCSECSGSSLSCSVCVSGEYILPSGGCDPCSKEGYSVINGFCTKCSINYCKRCSQGPAACDECVGGYFASVDVDGGLVCEKCLSQCLTCSGAGSNCTTCKDPLYLFSENNTCADCSQSDRYKTANGICAPCTASTCSEKRTVQVKIKIVANPSAPDGVHFAAFVSIVDPVSIDTSIVQKIFSGFHPVAQFVGKETKSVETPTVRTQVGTAGGQGYLTLVLIGMLEVESYTLMLASNEVTNIDGGDTMYIIDSYTSAFEFKNPRKSSKEEVESSQSQGRVVGGLAAGLPVSSPSGMDVISALVSADPTGITTKASQVVKLFNRVFYLNVNYGDRLGAFLESIEKVSATKRDNSSNSIRYHQSSGWRGKLSFNSVAGDFWTAFNWKIVVYLILWTLTGLFAYCAALEVRLSKWVLIVMFWVPKARLVILNMVIIDFAFYATHTGLHFSRFPETQLALICLTLVLVDLIDMLQISWNDSMWLRYMRLRKDDFESHQFSSSAHSLKDPSNIDKMDTSSTAHLNGENAIYPSADENAPFQTFTTVIDYRKTYEAIQSGFHSVALLGSTIKTDKNVYKMPAARLILILHMVRISLYQIVIASCQMASGLAIVFLITVELVKIVWVTYMELKYRVLQHRVALVSEVLQSLLLLLFLTLIATVHSKRMSETISDVIQMFGMNLILLAVVSEYILLLVSIGIKAIQAYRAYKISKQKKATQKDQVNNTKSKMKSFNWFVIYKNVLSEGVSNQTPSGNSLSQQQENRKDSKISSFSASKSTLRKQLPTKDKTQDLLIKQKKPIESTVMNSKSIQKASIENTRGIKLRQVGTSGNQPHHSVVFQRKLVKRVKPAITQS